MHCPKPQTIHLLLHRFITIVFAVYLELICNWLPLIKQKFHSILYSNHQETTYESLQRRTSYFKKIPLHLGLIVNEEDWQTVLENIPKITCWCIAVGVHTITVFDSKGNLKKNLSELQEEFTKEREQFLGSSFSSTQFRSASKRTRFDNPDKKDKDLKKPDYDLQVCSLEDGRWDVVNLARQFCKSIDEKKAKPSDLSIDSINANLYLSGVPEPELLLIFEKLGAVNFINGYLPWQIRLSEMITIGELSEFTCDNFVSTLASYSKTEQRYGR